MSTESGTSTVGKQNAMLILPITNHNKQLKEVELPVLSINA